MIHSSTATEYNPVTRLAFLKPPVTFEIALQNVIKKIFQSKRKEGRAQKEQN